MDVIFKMKTQHYTKFNENLTHNIKKAKSCRRLIIMVQGWPGKLQDGIKVPVFLWEKRLKAVLKEKDMCILCIKHVFVNDMARFV